VLETVGAEILPPLPLHPLSVTPNESTAAEQNATFFHTLVRMRKLDGITLRERLLQTKLSAAKRRIVSAHLEAAFEELRDSAGS